MPDLFFVGEKKRAASLFGKMVLRFKDVEKMVDGGVQVFKLDGMFGAASSGTDGHLASFKEVEVHQRSLAKVAVGT